MIAHPIHFALAALAFALGLAGLYFGHRRKFVPATMCSILGGLIAVGVLFSLGQAALL